MRRQFFSLLAGLATLAHATAVTAAPSGPAVGSIALTVFAVNYREKPAAANGIKKLAGVWHINMIEDRGGSIANHYSISGIPHLFIIGRDGKVLANHLGYGDRTLDELVSDINHALSETMPAAAAMEDQGT